MEPISPQELKSKLLSREVRLNPPATAEQIAALVAVAPNIHPQVLEIYETFNGFEDEDFDAGSFTGFWTIEKIVQSDQEFFALGRIPFADWSYDSDVYVHNAADPREPVHSFFDGRVIAPSLWEFWRMLTSGELGELSE